jgi:hypothetical protein
MELNITPADKYPQFVIPANAGNQKNTGCPRVTTCRGRLIKACPGLDPGSGMTEFGYLVAGLIVTLICYLVLDI